ncbi:probable inactive histone-lysine N-methyltransferase SUVR2 isoform X2 [Dendrobium catenatum]|uniref:probable inactive histone-lysine N-methyltransferase SUVR2 isoform X2 n=1 Tax=Dendrobium catenatum TaxID=906689 RepID=UPI0009F1D20E|nr:probable inactive histone-lysine N-methyltransferase SUVR2 isoform X2 [Dendrobium catenatum]
MAPSTQLQRAIAAVKAMKLLGFSQGVAKPVLKELLKVYGNNWEYIEAENYRLLAEAILDSQESKDPEPNEIDAAFTDEFTKPLKRLRHIEDPGPSQSTIESEASGETLLKKMKLVASSEDGIGEMAPQHAINFEEPSAPLGHGIPKLSRRIMRSSYQRDEQYLCDRTGNVVCYKEPKNELDTEALQEAAVVGVSTIPDKPMAMTENDISTNYNVPIAVAAPNGIPLGIADSSRLQLAPNEGNERESFQVSAQNVLAYVQDSTNVTIASSNTGKVKLSLNCSVECQNFKMPVIESVFKIVEDRCLKSYKILHPNFSLLNLMREICQSSADLAAESGVPLDDVVKLSPLKECLKNSESPGIHRRMTRRSFNVSPNLVSLETRRKSMNGLQSSLHIDGQSNGIHKNYAPQSSDNDVLQCSAIQPLHENAIIASLPQHFEHDIAKGEERIIISVINEFNREKTLPYFRYIPWNVVYQNAHVNFSLAQIDEDDCCINCFGNCLSVSIPCACTRESGGEFVYTLDGLLKKEFLNECISMNSYMDKRHVYCKNCPIERFKGENKFDSCKGHVVRKFIKECWSKCGCNKQCGNRVVQRGITYNLQVFYTADGKGWGLRTLEELPRGAFVCEYVGEILTSKELYDRTVQGSCSAKHTYTLVLDADWVSEERLRDEEALCLDATFYGNVGRFVNHRCFDANLVEVPVEWETPDHHYYHLAYFTTRKVEALEELTRDYGIDFKDHAHPIKAFKCLCGSSICRDSCRSRKRKEQVGS